MILLPVSSVRVRLQQNASPCLGELLSGEKKVSRLIPTWPPKDTHEELVNIPPSLSHTTIFNFEMALVTKGAHNHW